MRTPLRSGLRLFAGLAFLACATTEKMEEKVLAASPAPDAGFLEDPNKLAPHPERAPFDRCWWADDFSWANYDKMYVAAVGPWLGYLRTLQEWAEKFPGFEKELEGAQLKDGEYHIWCLRQSASPRK